MVKDEALSLEQIAGLEALKVPGEEREGWHSEIERFGPALREFLVEVAEMEFGPGLAREQRKNYDCLTEFHFSGAGPMPTKLAKEGSPVSKLDILYEADWVPSQIALLVEGSSVDVYLKHRALADFGIFYSKWKRK